MTLRLVKDRITRSALEVMAGETYGEMIKAVADVKREVIVIGGELHADGEALLLEQGSCLEDLWGFNIYFRETLEGSLEYTSLINVRPREGNASLLVKDPALRKKIFDIVQQHIDWSR